MKNTDRRTLDSMADAVLRADADLENAQRNYRELADDLAEALGYGERPVEHHLGNYKVTTQSNYLRSVDPIGIDRVKDILPSEMLDTLFPERRVLDLRQYAALKISNPAMFEIASRAVSIWAKPPTVVISATEVDA